jgi:16S rRNA (cytidine1402-2'-O)-methyltransferase
VIACFGSERQVVIAKEITKLHEKIRRGTLAELIEWIHSDKDLSKGEFVIVIQGAKEISLDELESRRILKILLVERTFKEAIRLTSEITRGKKNEIYKLAMELKKDEH